MLCTTRGTRTSGHSDVRGGGRYETANQPRIAAYLPQLKRESRLILASGIAVILLILALSLFLLEQSSRIAQTSAKDRAEQLSKTVSHQLLTTLTMIEHAMRYLNDEIVDRRQPERLAELGTRGQLPTDGISHFAFIGPDGRVMYDSLNLERLSVPLQAAERAFFEMHAQSARSHTIITPPLANSLSRDLFLPVSRGVRDNNGNFLGVLVAMIDVRSFDRIWADLGLDPTNVIDLVGNDGRIWLRWPRSVNGDPFVAVNETPGLNQPISVQRLGDWGLKIAATIDSRALEKQMAPARYAIITSALASSLLVAWFFWMLARRSEQAARERDTANKLRLHLLTALDAVPVEFIEYDEHGQAVLVNLTARRQLQAATSPLGLALDAILGAQAACSSDSETADQWQEWLKQSIADYERGGVADLRQPDGQWRRSYITRLEDGGRIVVRVDITEMKRREEQLAAEMERLNSVFQSSGAVIVLIDRDERIVVANQPALDIHGVSGAELAGRSFRDLKFGGLDAPMIEYWRKKGGEERLRSTEFECSLAAPNGARRIFRFTVNPVQDQVGQLKYVVLIGVDDTQRRAAEVRLFDISRLANLGEMATGIAHEINQPLAIIRLAADGAREELEMTEAATLPTGVTDFLKQKLERIANQTERASSIIRDLRAVARKPVGNKQPFDLAAAVGVSCDLMVEQLRLLRIDFDVQLPSPGPMVVGEANRIQQVVINFIVNARDALCERPAASAGRTGKISVGVRVDAAGGKALLVVVDDGPGIPADALPRLFEPFFTTKPVGKGTGLGLSISNEIVRTMDGEIIAENLPGGGACFSVVLPLALAPALEKREAEVVEGVLPS